jgi:hypothetical protein
VDQEVDLMALAVIGISPESQRVLLAHRENARGLGQAIGSALRQGLGEAQAWLQTRYLTGGDWRSSRAGNAPLAVRSGMLRAKATHELDQPLSGTFGIGEGVPYARMLLDQGETTVRPKNAKHLWVPIADNLDASGIMRMSPREAMAQRGPRGGKLLSIFESRSGNLVAFLRTGGTYKRTTKNGRQKGDVKGKLLFVLLNQVTVKGTDALARTAQDLTPRFTTLLEQSLTGFAREF